MGSNKNGFIYSISENGQIYRYVNSPLIGMSQYDGSPDSRAYCYTELAVSSPAVAEAIVSA